jgi:ABC-type enterochelin transport system permease subunit
MAGAAIGSWLAVSATGGDRVNPEALFGMAGPLVAVCVSWLVVQRIHRVTPERTMAAMIIGFAAKFVFFGAYVAVMLGALSLRPVPFMTAFVSYFIALYAMQALFFRRLLTSVE